MTKKNADFYSQFLKAMEAAKPLIKEAVLRADRVCTAISFRHLGTYQTDLAEFPAEWIVDCEFELPEGVTSQSPSGVMISVDEMTGIASFVNKL